MKRVRLIILTGLILAALAAAVIPVLAGGPPSGATELNSSFEGDKNGDNQPDKWNSKGDVLRVCDHGYEAWDNCMMVFKPSNSGAALWQTLTDDGWKVVTEEATCEIATGNLGAINQDVERAYFGYIFDSTSAGPLTVYTLVKGGTYPISMQYFNIELPGGCVDLPVSDIYQVRWGILSFPGDGYLGVDWIFPSD